MIFGKPFEQVKAEREEWHPFFCLFPRELDDGRIVWLRTVLRRSVFVPGNWGDPLSTWYNFYKELKNEK